MRLKRILLFGGVCLFVLSIQAQSLSSSLHPKREFRAAWIQTVHGHFRDMPTRQLQVEVIRSCRLPISVASVG